MHSGVLVCVLVVDISDRFLQSLLYTHPQTHAHTHTHIHTHARTHTLFYCYIFYNELTFVNSVAPSTIIKKAQEKNYQILVCVRACVRVVGV